VFLTLLRRPFVSGSDRAADRWDGRLCRGRRRGSICTPTQSAPPRSNDGLFGRGTIGEGARTLFSPRCVLGGSQLDLMFMDTTILRAHQPPPIAVEQHGDDHLPQIMAVVHG
jgi:hypothetical protein